MLVHNRCGYKPLRQNDYKAVINPGEMEAPHAHIFKKASNIGRVFRDGTLDKSLAANREAIMFLKRNLVSIMEMIDAFYGKR